eukprot:5005452-Pyramimonas_sp.AAC.1
MTTRRTERGGVQGAAVAAEKGACCIPGRARCLLHLPVSVPHAPGNWASRGVQRLAPFGRWLRPFALGKGGSEPSGTAELMSFQGVPSPRNHAKAAHVKLQTRLLASMPSSTSQQNPR